MKEELIAIVLMVAIVAVSAGPTGMYSLQRVQLVRTEGPYLSEGLVKGEQLAPEAAEYCTEAMRYAGRQYEEYLRCCSDTCTQPCKDTVGKYEVSGCIQMCGRTCREIMTQAYLDLKPGTWR